LNKRSFAASVCYEDRAHGIAIVHSFLFGYLSLVFTIEVTNNNEFLIAFIGENSYRTPMVENMIEIRDVLDFLPKEFVVVLWKTIVSPIL
jgi:hypothetical protein